MSTLERMLDACLDIYLATVFDGKHGPSLHTMLSVTVL